MSGHALYHFDLVLSRKEWQYCRTLTDDTSMPKKQRSSRLTPTFSVFTRRDNPSLASSLASSLPPDARTSDERLLYNLKRLAGRGLWARGEAADGRRQTCRQTGATLSGSFGQSRERWLYSALSGKPTEDLLLLETCEDKRHAAGLAQSRRPLGARR